MLLSGHMMLAAFTNIEELQLSEEEAHNLTNALERVAEHYDFGADPKTLAWANLVFVAGGIYGTRIFAYSRRKASEKNARPTLVSAGPGSSSPEVTPKKQTVNGSGQTSTTERPLNPSDLFGFAGPDSD